MARWVDVPVPLSNALLALRVGICRLQLACNCVGRFDDRLVGGSLKGCQKIADGKQRAATARQQKCGFHAD
jgi:hypothetical protein